MSLGFDIDFFALISLLSQIRKSFVGAPEQFRAISDDVRGFSIVLQDVEASCTELDPEQSHEYHSVVTSCKHLLVQLKKSLEEYGDVAEAGKTRKNTAIKRVWKRLKWEPDDIRDIRNQISVKIATLKTLSDQVTNQNIAKLIRHQEDTERVTTLKWVSDINYVAQQNDIVLRCQAGSRRWLFESTVYLEWRKRKGSLLFCPGNAGTGKTFTTAMVIESLRLTNDAETLTTYMYCSYQNHTQTIEKLLCSLLRVALEEADHEADGAVSACRQLRLSNKLLSRQHCLSLLRDLFSRFIKVNLIVDALDELTNEVRRLLIYDLLKLHEHSNVSLFVTSRGIPEIQHLFEGCEMYTSLEVRSSDEDIRNFLRDNIFQLPNFVARSRKLQDEVIDSVTNASAGMFLLAELYLKSLANIISVGSLRTRLSNLATGSNAYDTLYEDSMLRIGFQGPESERIAVQMLLVLTCARRPLSPQELSHALSIDESSEAFEEDMVPDMDDLVAACTGLVVLDDTSNIVHLVHKSAAEYFERTRSHWFPRANEKMAFMCLRYLQIAETKPEETRTEQAPFFHYAKANWSYHSIEGEEEAAKNAVMSDALRTNSATDPSMSLNKLAVTQLAIQQMTKEVVDVQSSIVEACRAGHQAWVEQLLVVRNYDTNACRIRQEMFISEDGALKPVLPITPFKDNVLLTIAAARGDYSMAQMLLARGADPNIFNFMGQTPLLIAVINGFDNLVSLLLDHRLIKPDLMCHYSATLSTAFLVSIELAREACFRMLLERSNRETRDSHKRGAIWLAAAYGYTGIISELLKWPDVEIDYADTEFCGSPLAAAIRNEHEEAALLLLPYSKCQSCSHCGITPMYYAVCNERHNLLERLLEHDASAVDSELSIYPHGENGQRRHLLIYCEQGGNEHTKTPLITALYLQDAHATRLLLPYADVNQGFTWQPLHQAAEWGNVEIFELLLRKENVEPDPVDEYGRTPFLLAAERGNCDIMNVLIKKGGIQYDRRDAHGYAADDYIIDPYFQNPGYFRVLASVLNIDVNEKDSSGSNLLHKACSLYPKASFEYGSNEADEWDISEAELLKDGIFRAELLENNSCPLVTELLMRPRVDVNLLDRLGNTPLLLAVKNHQRDVVRVLLEREDTDVLVQDWYGNDALLLASEYVPMFQQLYPWQAIFKNYNLLSLRGQIPTRYKVDHWPEVLNAEFKEYDESIFGMLIRDKRTNSHCKNYLGESFMARVAQTGTRSMVLAVLETTELASDPEIMLPEGKNLLSIALEENSDDDAVDLLIAHCPSVVLQKADVDGRTPLSYAVQRDTSQATRLLLAAGVDTNAVDKFTSTPLFYAVWNRDSDAACRLIAVDTTQINFSAESGFTPLMQASSELNLPVVSALFERPDVDILALDSNGHSFLCHLMMSLYFSESQDRFKDVSTKELDSVVHRINCLLQLHVGDIKAPFHSPFICALEKYTYHKFKVFHIEFDDDEWQEARRRTFVNFMSKVQHYTTLSDYFHPGLDLSRCITRPGLLEILGAETYYKYDDYDEHNDYDDYEDRDLCAEALQLFR